MNKLKMKLKQLDKLKSGKDNKLFMEMLDLMEFGLYKDDNKYALVDFQGANLGGIENERFNNAGEILDRMTTYENDYIVEALEKLDDYEYEDWEDFVKHLKTTDLYSPNESKWDIDILEMICNCGKYVDLSKIELEKLEVSIC